jgi:hypothetical protein
LQTARVRRGWLGALLLAGMATVLLSACRPVEGTGRVGDTIKAGDYQVTVASMANPADPPDRFTNPKVGNRFVKFDLKVSNLGDQHLPVAASYFTLRDSGGVDNPAMRGIPTDTGLREASLPPVQKDSSPRELTTVLYFEMASNLQPAQLIFAPQVVGWNTRVTVNLGT